MHQRRTVVGLLVVACLAVLAACTSVPPVAVMDGFRAVDGAGQLQVVDARPEADKSTAALSYLVTSCDYGIRRLGDELTVPARLVLLQSDLFRVLGPVVQGKVVTVNHYTIHQNSSAALRGAVYGGGSGAVGSVMQNVGSHCPRDKTTAGWYAASEVNGPYSPLIVEIEASVDGRTQAVRTVYEPSQEFARVGEPEAVRALFAAMTEAHEALAQMIRGGSAASR